MNSATADQCFLTALETVALLRSGAARAVDLSEAFLARVRHVDPSINSFTEVFDDDFLAAAAATDSRLRGGDVTRPLDGVTISVKDLIAIAGARLTRGSMVFRDFVATADAPVVERSKAAGAMIVGKTTTSELGWKCVTDSPLFGATRNPWDVSRTAGGSSGGAAAAVAAGLCTIAIGTDAAGSIRIPASFCGVVGLKPTFGAIPIYPAPAPANIVHVGIATRSVDDAALALGVLGGRDSRDRFSAAAAPRTGSPTHLVSSASATARGLRVAWTADFGNLAVDDEVAHALADVARIFEMRGINVRRLVSPMPSTDSALRTYFYGALGAQLRALDSASLDSIDPGLRKVFELSLDLTAHDVINADLLRAELWDYLRRVYDDVDVIVCPVTGTTAFEVGADTPPHLPGGSESDTAWMAFNYPFNLVGLPALSVPCGRSRAGLPIGVQLVARHWDEVALFSLAKILEEEIPSVGRPSITTTSVRAEEEER